MSMPAAWLRGTRLNAAVILAAMLIVAAPAVRLNARRPVPAPHTVPNLEARLRAHIDSLAFAGGARSRVVFTPGNTWSVNYVLRVMRRATSDVRADTFTVRRRSKQTTPLINAVAVLKGRSDSVLVICAHIDASASRDFAVRDGGWERNWMRRAAPGADDNATGIAAMLETLDLAAHAGATPRYTMMFVACNAEERNPDYAGLSHRDGHHLGSRRLATMLRERGLKVRGVIAMDMVGWNPGGDYTPVFSTGRSAWLARDLGATRDALKLRLGLGLGAGGCNKSDNESFDRVGIPAVLLMESCAPWRSDGRHPRNPTYHTGRDLPNSITWSILLKVTRLVAAYAMRG